MQVFGTPCDVSQFDQVKALVAFAEQNLGNIHIWVNNAAVPVKPRRNLWEVDPQAMNRALQALNP